MIDRTITRYGMVVNVRSRVYLMPGFVEDDPLARSREQLILTVSYQGREFTSATELLEGQSMESALNYLFQPLNNTQIRRLAGVNNVR